MASSLHQLPNCQTCKSLATQYELFLALGNLPFSIQIFVMIARQSLARAAVRVIPSRAPGSASFAASRHYAAAAATAQQDVKLPATVFGLDGTYATALVRFF